MINRLVAISVNSYVFFVIMVNVFVNLFIMYNDILINLILLLITIVGQSFFIYSLYT